MSRYGDPDNKNAEIKIAEGEAEYMSSRRHTPPEDFYNFIRSSTSSRPPSGSNKTIILDKDSEIARILYGGN